MIQKARQAEVTYCKQAKTIAPVEGRTKAPDHGIIRDGQEHIRTVEKAAVITASLLQCEKAIAVKMASTDGQHMEKAELVEVIPAAEKQITPQKANCKSVACRDVKRDITLKTLFHISKGQDR